MNSPAERFWSRVDRSGGSDACWPWLGPRTRGGYGITHYGGRTETAHRAAHLIGVGPIPDGFQIDHRRCDNPPCCNPAHLVACTPRENYARIPRRLKAACFRGHPMSGANLRITRGTRVCRACQRYLTRRWRDAHPGYVQPSRIGGRPSRDAATSTDTKGRAGG